MNKSSIRYNKTCLGYRIFIILIVIVAFVARCKNLSQPLLDSHYFRQTQTATVVRNFYKEGIDILHTKLDILGIGKEQILLLEFPLYQMIVTCLAYLVGYSDGLGRVVSIIFGISTGLVLLLLINHLTKNKILGLTTFIFFLFAPLNIYFQQAYMIESTVVFLHFLSLYLWILYLDKKNNFCFLLNIVISSLAYLHKIIYMILLFPMIVSLIVFYKGKKRLLERKIIIGIIFPVIVLFIWQKIVDHINLIHGNYFFTTISKGQWMWNFSTLQDRLSLITWGFRLKTLVDSITKITLVYYLIGIILIFGKQNKFYYLWLIWSFVIFFYILIFFGVVSQNYYFMPLIPSISILAAYGVWYFYLVIEKKFNRNKYITRSILIIIFISYIYTGIKNVQPMFNLDSQMQDKLVLLNKYMTEPGNMIILFPQRDWNSVYTYYTNRKGVALGKEQLEEVSKYESEGYRYLIINDIKSFQKEAFLSKYLINKIKIYSQKDFEIYKL